MKHCIILNGFGDLAFQAENIAGLQQASGLQVRDCHAIVLSRENLNIPNLLLGIPAATVTIIQIPTYQPEQVLAILKRQVAAHKLCLFSGDFAGRELAVRLACRINGISLIGVCSAEINDVSVICTKHVYASNMEATIQLDTVPCCLSADRALRGFLSQSAPELIETLPYANAKNNHILKMELHPQQAVDGLAHAPFILAAGRGVKSREDFAQVAQAAERMGAQLGVSRPVAMNAWAPLEQLLGVSGVMSSPDICLVVGASGAGAFLSGIQGSGVIAVINTDPDAPIMRAADVAVVGSYEDILPALLTVVNENSQRKG